MPKKGFKQTTKHKTKVIRRIQEYYKTHSHPFKDKKLSEEHCKNISKGLQEYLKLMMEIERVLKEESSSRMDREADTRTQTILSDSSRMEFWFTLA
jgi:hypothetical protein